MPIVKVNLEQVREELRAFDWTRQDALTDEDIASQIAENPDAVPELTEDWFKHARQMHGDTVIRRGRPKSETPKKLVSLRLDAEIIDRFRATGAGWQSRINETLRRHMPE
jgi:uncharacterized protein (DUF4415 family)